MKKKLKLIRMTKKNMVDVITLTGVEAILSVVFFIFDDGSVWNILLEKNNQYGACKEWYRNKMLYNIGAYQYKRKIKRLNKIDRNNNCM